MDHYLLGVLLGAAGAVMLGLGVWLISRKKTGAPRYDERQIIGRGKAFEAGFCTLLVAGFLVSLLERFEVLPGDGFLWHILAMMLGVGVYVLTAIHFDAYLSMTEKPRQYYIMGACFTVAMGLAAVGNLLNEDADDHMIGWMQVMVAALWVFLVIALWIHNRKRAGEDEES